MASPVTPLKTVAVDLAPMLPGGENGGIKILALNLVRHFAQGAQETKFILLTSGRIDQELSVLDAPNVQRFRIDAPAAQRPAGENAELLAAGLLQRLLPSAGLDYIAATYRKINRRRGASALLRRLGADLLFSPFMTTTFDDGTTPFVSIVHDLQHRYLPQNFNTRMRKQLDRRLQHIINRAARIVCLSDYVRGTMVDAGARADRLETIHIALHARMRTVGNTKDVSLLAKWRLDPDSYLLYPANFWPHKNHPNLLDAMRAYFGRHPESGVKLVLTGDPGSDRERVIQLVQTSGLGDRIILPGFLPEYQFAPLLEHCLAVIFPSLYEGFGMPVLEAMASGKPVLCSNVTSLPEITAGAALLFDPHDVAAMTQAIEQIECDAQLRSTLIEKGRVRAASFGDAQQMANRYLRLFEGALKARC